jgi:hypothetical protein
MTSTDAINIRDLVSHLRAALDARAEAAAAVAAERRHPQRCDARLQQVRARYREADDHVAGLLQVHGATIVGALEAAIG